MQCIQNTSLLYKDKIVVQKYEFLAEQFEAFRN